MEFSLFDSCQCVDIILDRCHSLYNRMARNLDRPSWELEYLSLLVQLAELMNLPDSKLSTSFVNLDEVSKQVSSLEARYSELLYKLSSK